MFSQPYDSEQTAAEAGFDPTKGVIEVELLSAEDEEQFEQAKQGWGDHPVTRAVGLGLLMLGVGGLGAIVFLLPRGGTADSDSESESNAVVKALQQQLKILEKENAAHRASLALAGQGDIVQAGEGITPESTPPELSEAESTPPKPNVVAIPATKPVPVVPQAVPPVAPKLSASPTLQPVVNRPAPTPIITPRSLPAKVPQAQTPRLSPPPQQVALPTLRAAALPEQPHNPEDALAKLKALGSYGEGNTSPARQVANLPQPAPAQSLVPAVQSVSHQRSQQPSVVAGTTATGILDIPVLWSRQTSEPFVMVTLSESLGQLPQGTKLKGIARVEPETGNTLVMFTAVLQNGWEQSLPEGVIFAAGNGGTPLQAQASPKSQEGARFSGLESTILRGLARGVTDELTSGIESDILSGVVEEGVNDVLNRFDEPREQGQPSNETVSWTLAQGTAVELIVNQSFSIDGLMPEPEATPAVQSAPQPLPVPAAAPPIAPASPTLLVTNTSPSSLPIPVPEALSPESTPAVVSSQTIPVAEAQFIGDATPVNIWPGFGSNISFIKTGEHITRAWLDDPTLVTLQFDEPLCESSSADCTSGQPTVVHLRWIDESLEFDHLPSGDRTFLTVMTQAPTGEERLHVFQIERATGEPSYHTIEVPAPQQTPVQPRQQTELLTSVEPSTQTMSDSFAWDSPVQDISMSDANDIAILTAGEDHETETAQEAETMQEDQAQEGSALLPVVPHASGHGTTQL